jgi:ubiquinone/menaquinone biosynthesis C-methylase UbiE
MGRPMDYSDFAKTYRASRFAVDWVLKPLTDNITGLPHGANILEPGCGTGNYIIALSELHPEYNYYGSDLSDKMLEQARLRNSNVKFTKGDCEKGFPYPTSQFDFVFCVDVIHHIVSLDNFFSESRRILKNGSCLSIVTDTEENMDKRSLTKYFPGTKKIEMDRYPAPEELHKSASENLFKLSGIELAEGEIDLSSGYLEKLEAKCSSAIRLLSEEEFKAGIENVHHAAAIGEKWFSSYSVIKYTAI